MNDQKEWEDSTKALMVSEGWELDIDNEDMLGFTFKLCNGSKWGHYIKKDSREALRQYPAINFMSAKEK